MSSWRTIKLGEVCIFQNGFAFKSLDYVDNGYFVMRITNVQDGCIVLNNPKYITRDHISEDNPFVLHEGDILMSLTGNVGRVGVIKTEHLPAVLNQRVARIVIKSPELLDKNYLFSYFRCPIFFKTVVSGGKGMAQQNVSTSFISDLVIPLPPLEEQKKIVKVLEEKLGKAKEAIKLREEAITDTEKIFPTTLSQILNDHDGEVMTIKQVAQVKTGGTPSKTNAEFWKGSIPWVSPKDMKVWDINDSSDHVSLVAVEESATNLVPENSILVVVRSGILKHTLPVAVTSCKVTFNQDIKAIIPNSDKILPIYLAYYIKGFEKLILQEGIKKGVTVQSFEGKYLENFPIKVPDIKTQQKVVRELDELSLKVSELRKLQESQLSDLKALEQAYLREAFNGELV